MARLGPLQRQMREVARAGAGWDAAAYGRLSNQWGAWGVLALLTPLGAMFLMVLKPAS